MSELIGTSVLAQKALTHDGSSDKYFEDHLSLSQKDANELHLKYYKQYGLALEGLVRYHKVNALEYNAKVDDALPLEEILSPNLELRKLLQDIDRSKVRLWLFTNAYITHGKRVVTLLGIDDLFEGITYCDYGAESLVCKPHKEAFETAMRDAGISSWNDCYFVGSYQSFIPLNLPNSLHHRRFVHQHQGRKSAWLDCGSCSRTIRTNPSGASCSTSNSKLRGATRYIPTVLQNTSG